MFVGSHGWLWVVVDGCGWLHTLAYPLIKVVLLWVIESMQPATTIHNYPQPPATSHNHPKPSTTTRKTNHNHPEPTTTTQKLLKKTKTCHKQWCYSILDVHSETEVEF